MLREKYVKAIEKYIAREICHMRNMPMHWRKYKLLDAERLKGQGLLMAKEVVKCVTAKKKQTAISKYLLASIQILRSHQKEDKLSWSVVRNILEPKMF